jgi:hypothetical protein
MFLRSWSLTYGRMTLKMDGVQWHIFVGEVSSLQVLLPGSTEHVTSTTASYAIDTS